MLQFDGDSVGVDFNLINSKVKLLKPYLNTPISEGTTKLQDLMPKFLDAAEAITKLLYLKDENITVLNLREEWQDVVDSDNWKSGFGSTHAWSLSDELETLLNDLAPEGYYFGSHQDDGASFGFWEVIK